MTVVVAIFLSWDLKHFLVAILKGVIPSQKNVYVAKKSSGRPTIKKEKRISIFTLPTQIYAITKEAT